MITLVTGYNNTGKSSWIQNKIKFKVQEYLENNDEITDEDDEYTSEIFDNLYSDCIINKVYNDLMYCKPDNTIPICHFNCPENGLHPSLQTKLIEDFIELHYEDYDIYIETYSDHIVNAVRITIKQGLIRCDDVKVLFFKTVDDIVEIKLDSNGQFNKRPNGFFDEYSKQLDKLID